MEEKVKSTLNIEVKTQQNNQQLLLLRLNKLRTELIADVCCKLNIESRVINGISPISKKMKICGPAYTAIYADKSDKKNALFQFNRFQVDHIPKDAVLVIENSGSVGIASVWGELVSLAAKTKGVLGTITNGSVRDSDSIKNMGYPVFAAGKALNNSNEKYKVIATQCEVKINEVIIKPGDIILADMSGIVVIDPADLEAVVVAAEKKAIDEQKISELLKQGNSLQSVHQMMTTKKDTDVNNRPFYQNNYVKLGLFGIGVILTTTLAAAYFYKPKL